MSTKTLTHTSQRILEALELMQTEGRGRGGAFINNTWAAMDDAFKYGYCPLGALAAVRTGLRGDSVTSALGVYGIHPETIAVAQAIEERYPTADPMVPFEFLLPHQHAAYVHGWNDEMADDEAVFAVMRRAAEIAEDL